MVKNTYISLAPNSKHRKDAEGTLKYTLFLNYEIPELNGTENAIGKIIQNCKICCSNLFHDKGITSNNLNFFGTLLLHSLDNFNVQQSWSQNLIEKILQHCIMSSYHAILTELLQNQKITGYHLCNQAQYTGFHYMKKSGMLRFKNNTAAVSFPSFSSNREKSSKAGSFAKTTQTHVTVLSNFKNLFIMDDTRLQDNSTRYFLQFSNLFFRICSVHTPTWKNLDLKTSNFNKDNILDVIEKTTIKMEPRINFSLKAPEKAFTDFHGDIADSLYYYYLAERLFNFNLFYGLLRNIEQVGSQQNYNIYHPDIVKTLCCCKNLPNIFSRQLFLEYAFSQFKLVPESYDDFWHDNDLFRSGIAMESTRRMPQGFHFSKWLQQYELFMNYMAKFVIPIYEWCFILILLEAIEKAYPSESHIAHLLKAVDLLADYMSKNYTSMFQPLSPSSNSDMVNIAVKHENAYTLKNLPDETIQQVMKEFFSFNSTNDSSSQNNTDLNLKQLCPEFFTTDRGRNMSETNYSRIRKFYIDLIRYTYLDP